ncbi:MAG: DUF421 domain-containing protein [Oscillospiraceae bacterium]|nr:DUF421 domain-containing protein [Oscillospiraceae bacterium]
MELLQVGLTSVVSFLVLFVLAKFIGHRQIAQLSAFDYIIGITIGSIAAEMATELEEPLQPLLAMVVYALLAMLLEALALKYPRMRKFIDGTPTIILDNGKLYRNNMKKARLDLTEFLIQCRQQGYFDLGAIQTAVYESNGQLSILPAAPRRPATPEDLGLAPEKEQFFIEVIMDGRILSGNLQRMGVNEAWLEKQLQSQGYHKASEIYLGLADSKKQLSLYAVE